MGIECSRLIKISREQFGSADSTDLWIYKGECIGKLMEAPDVHQEENYRQTGLGPVHGHHDHSAGRVLRISATIVRTHSNLGHPRNKKLWWLLNRYGVN